MQTIHKYSFPDELDPDESFKIPMPIGAKILSIQAQRGSPVIWAEVDQDRPIESRVFRAIFTGRELPGEKLKYIGTIQMPLPVVHIYEVE